MILPMASAGALQAPAIRLDELNCVSNLHLISISRRIAEIWIIAPSRRSREARPSRKGPQGRRQSAGLCGTRSDFTPPGVDGFSVQNRGQGPQQAPYDPENHAEQKASP
jgi:hypothetical protein